MSFLTRIVVEGLLLVVKSCALHVIIVDSFQGCTATVLLVWADGHENFYAQCANVGDSACVMKYVLLLSFYHS